LFERNARGLLRKVNIQLQTLDYFKKIGQK